MSDADPLLKTIRLSDYQPPDFFIESVALEFDLHATETRVRAQLSLRRNGTHDRPLRLDGSPVLELVSASGAAQIAREGDTLVVEDPRNGFTLDLVTRINPSANSQLMGLYMSGGIFCTQCEAEGFRRITFFLDRPDVMSRYHVTLRADAGAFPVLLANGNKIAERLLEDGRLEAVWEDPHAKPCYLFAAVAGDLAALEDRFTTMEGRDVRLAIWVNESDVPRCRHAMDSLKRSMRWDEDQYGRAYDLDVFNIVAVADFNFGAMENKSLNIFNSKYILADANTATDADFDAVEAIVAHEYFHNWSGNRVTCRDWFQLSLKEGFTVFRDQQYSADQGSAAVKRIEDVRGLRMAQFLEDAGPLAHPVRPESYMEISNFYTATVYNKGAEVIRMMSRLLGLAKFRAGCDLYFARHDGEAVTCDDFVRAMEEASGQDLGQFRLWYSQAGTPLLSVTLTHDEVAATAQLSISQQIPDTPGQSHKKPMDMPLEVALLDAASGAAIVPSTLLRLREARQHFSFEGVASRPVLSFLRGFTAPVIVAQEVDRADLATLAAHDDDPFARYEALQTLALACMDEQIARFAQTGSVTVDPLLVRAMENTLRSEADEAFKALALALPSESYVAGRMSIAQVDAIHAVRQAFRAALGRELAPFWWRAHAACADAGNEYTPRAKGKRALRNQALAYLMLEPDEQIVRTVWAQFESARTMTDRMGALVPLADSSQPQREAALARFHADWQHDANVLDKWFSLQALSHRSDTLANVLALAQHADFSIANPNRLRSLVGAFSGNQKQFHAAGGEGYRFLADQVLAVDGMNAQAAARLVTALGRWKRFDAGRSALMRAQLERIIAQPGLSRDVTEMVSKSLEG
jgi:aminopeptidase N